MVAYHSPYPRGLCMYVCMYDYSIRSLTTQLHQGSMNPMTPPSTFESCMAPRDGVCACYSSPTARPARQTINQHFGKQRYTTDCPVLQRDFTSRDAFRLPVTHIYIACSPNRLLTAPHSTSKTRSTNHHVLKDFQFSTRPRHGRDDGRSASAKHHSSIAPSDL